MAQRGLPRGGAGSRAGRLRAHPAVRSAQRLWPIALEAKRRWDRLTPEQQAHYKRLAADYARKARSARRPTGRRY